MTTPEAGQLARVTYQSGKTYTAFYSGYHRAWISSHSGQLFLQNIADVRPLLVLDPQDCSQVSDRCKSLVEKTTR